MPGLTQYPQALLLLAGYRMPYAGRLPGAGLCRKRGRQIVLRAWGGVRVGPELKKVVESFRLTLYF